MLGKDRPRVFRSSVLVGDVDDLHKVRRLQRSAADQPAISPIRPEPDGAPGEISMPRAK
jgi:hypothetical protein